MTPDVCIDIGNTRIKWYVPRGRLFHPSTESESLGWERDWQQVAYRAGLPKSHTSWAVCGVNPPRVEQFNEWVRSRGDALFHVQHFSQIPLKVELPYPDRVGLDRLLSAVAAKQLKPADQGAIVVDAGTAVTVNAISREGVFLGGAIAPGLRTMRVALHQQTAKLPLVDDSADEGQGLPGQTTQTAIFHGTRELFLGGVSRLIVKTQQSLNTPCQVFFTGGDGELLATNLPEFAGPFNAFLTLEGLRITAEATS